MAEEQPRFINRRSRFLKEEVLLRGVNRPDPCAPFLAFQRKPATEVYMLVGFVHGECF